MTPSTPPLPPAEELALVDRELARLEHRRSWLLTRRAWLLSMIEGAAAARARDAAGPVAAPGGRDPGEASGRGAQNALLLLGGVLLSVAAVAFTVVSWGSLGIGGRGAVLAAVTGAALAAPVVLLRRGLASTAESVAALGLLLMVLDAYALRQVGFGGGDAVGYAAGAAAVLAAVWAGYGRLLPGLVLPGPAAVGAAQLPLLLWAAAERELLDWALTGTAAFDVAVALWVSRRAVRRFAAGCAAVTGVSAAAVAGVGSASAQSPGGALGPAAVFAALAVIALFAAARSDRAALPASAAAGLALVAGAGGVVREVLPAGWGVSAYALAAAVPAAAAGLRLPRGTVRGLGAAAAGVLGTAALLTLPLTALTLVGPVTALPGLWRGAPGDAYAALGVDLSPSFFAAAPLTLLPAAAAAAAGARWARTAAGTPPGTRPGRDAVRAWAPGAAAGLLWAAVVTVPAAVRMGYGPTVVYGLVTAVGTLGWAVLRRGGTVPLVLGCGLTGAVGLGGLALADRTATFTVLGVLVVALVAAAVATRAGEAVRAVLAVAAAGFGSWLLMAVSRAAALTAAEAGLLLMAVPAVACGVAAAAARRPRSGVPEDEGATPGPLAVALETTAAVVGAVAVLLASGDLPMTSVLLGLAGVIAAATALRPGRRRPAGATAAALFVLAAWARLAAWEVTVPEAYSLPVSVPALAVGVLHRRRVPGTSSWAAYGPGLAATLVPSLTASLGDPGWLRPLLLGGAALALTLHGARARLQAPLVLGGTVLALVALHELAPYVVQMVGVLPRWLPPALAGLLLLTVGATYEQRLRDARRLRDSVHRMR
ncbi:SCO7613 C-terminal domain-containing membrane protein [Streptomyces sp. NPDC094448]|uniref:SCO7613 C-terminal domain-containing membrane protein n=1 Tax=Streptomyces sp. NPDC094448 TaxID=3366063 RepID=UPI00382B12A9